MVDRVSHPIDPWYSDEATVLILGTFPSPKSRERMMYYGHPQNRFWRTLATLFSEDVPRTAAEAKAFCLRHRLALWDVIASCTITGAADHSIDNVVVNDISSLLNKAPIEHIFCTGKKAHALYKSLIEPSLGISAQLLPSASAANRAHWPDHALINAYQVIVEASSIKQKAFTKAPLNLFQFNKDNDGEQIDIIFENDALRIERIVSWHHPSPIEGYYDQIEGEWVSVLSGWAILSNPNGDNITLHAGDHIWLKPHQLHRVVNTSSPCIWLVCFDKKVICE